MVNRLYPKYKEGVISGVAGMSWTSNDVKGVLIDLADYTPNFTTDTFLADIPVIARISTSPNLASKSNVLSVVDADDIEFTSVTGDQFEALVIYFDTGNPATSRLILFMDSGSGLAFTPSGGNILVRWSNSADRIFSWNG